MNRFYLPYSLVIAFLSTSQLFSQDSRDPVGYYIGVAGFKNAGGMEGSLASGHNSANISGTFRLIKIKDQGSPQMNIKLGVGPGNGWGYLHGGVLIGRDPRFGAQTGLGLWGSALLTSHVYVGASLEVLKSKAATNRQAIFSIGYHFWPK